MIPRKLILLLLALIIAVGTVMFARSAMKPSGKNGPSSVSAEAPVEILVVARDLPAGTLLKEADMRWQSWPAEAKSDAMILKGKQEIKDFAGAVVRSGLRAGEPVLGGRILKRGEQGFLSAVLEANMRAISVKITPVTGVAGLIFPGDRVDVILTHRIEQAGEDRSQERRVSETVVTDVRVLALDQKTDDQAKEPKLADVATLEVNPRDAEKIALMADWGTLSLVLRSLASDQTGSSGVDAAARAVMPDGAGGIALDAAALQEPPRLTWDSDVSQVMPRPPGRESAVRKIQIMRGKETAETTFGMQQ